MLVVLVIKEITLINTETFHIVSVMQLSVEKYLYIRFCLLQMFQVEEINQNFYEYMGIPNDASTSDVRKAYRRLSLVLHPDRNSAEDASEKFR